MIINLKNWKVLVWLRSVDFLSAWEPGFHRRPRLLSAYSGQAFSPNFTHFYPHRPKAFCQNFSIFIRIKIRHHRVLSGVLLLSTRSWRVTSPIYRTCSFTDWDGQMGQFFGCLRFNFPANSEFRCHGNMASSFFAGILSPNLIIFFLVSIEELLSTILLRVLFIGLVLLWSGLPQENC